MNVMPSIDSVRCLGIDENDMQRGWSGSVWLRVREGWLSEGAESPPGKKMEVSVCLTKFINRVDCCG